MAPGGLRPRHLIALKLLHEHGAVSQQALAETLSLDPTNVVGLLNDLEERRLITRRHDPEDRRRHIVEVSSLGEEELELANARLGCVEDQLLTALSAEERGTLYDLLVRVVGVAATCSLEVEPPTCPGWRSPRLVDDIVVRIQQGRLRGAPAGYGYRFLAIPYARPPAETGRFAAPEPARPWDGVRDANTFGAAALQAERGLSLTRDPHVGGPDCLNLNVFTPAMEAAGRPVLFWAHGGGFVHGSNASHWYNGAKFARDGVVVVASSRCSCWTRTGLPLMCCGMRWSAAVFGLIWLTSTWHCTVRTIPPRMPGRSRRTVVSRVLAHRLLEAGTRPASATSSAGPLRMGKWPGFGTRCRSSLRLRPLGVEGMEALPGANPPEELADFMHASFALLCYGHVPWLA